MDVTGITGNFITDMKKMSLLYKLFFIIWFSACISKSSHGQFSFSPSTTLIKNQGVNLMTYDSIHISNNSSDTINLNWTLLLLDTLEGSFFDFCASGNCRLGMPDTGSFPPIEPGSFGWAGAHFWTGNTPVTSITKIWIYDEKNSSIGDTITFILNAVTNNIIDHSEIDNLFSIGPNPTTRAINITSKKYKASNIYLYNTLGQLQYSSLVNSYYSTIDLTTLSNGIYFIGIESEVGVYFKKIIINK